MKYIITLALIACTAAIIYFKPEVSIIFVDGYSKEEIHQGQRALMKYTNDLHNKQAEEINNLKPEEAKKASKK